MRLDANPRDVRRNLPIPYANVIDLETGEYDFKVVSGMRSLECAKTERCGLCAQPLEGIAVFLGGVAREEGMGVYTDPPMHEECAEAATKLCPHLRLSRAKRAGEHRFAVETVTGPGWSGAKPEVWYMTFWKGYAIAMIEDVLAYVPGYIPDGQGGFEETEMIRQRVFSYDEDGVLTEVTE